MAKVSEEIRAGEEGASHVSREKFNKVFSPAFTRPSNLRQLVLYKTKDFGT